MAVAIARSTSAMPTSASALRGSITKARWKKPPARAMYSGVSPLLNQALPWKYKSIASGRSDCSDRLASSSVSLALSALASLDTISSCISKQIRDGFVEAISPELIAGTGVDQLHVHPEAVATTLHRTL
jgi:hypothetical protein